MNGNEHDDHGTWYRLKDEMTEQDKGYINDTGETRETDDETAGKVRDAFSRDLIVQENEVVEELGGVCYDGVCTIGPNDPQHNRMVLQNLGALTGLRPEPVSDTTESPDNDDRK